MEKGKKNPIFGPKFAPFPIILWMLPPLDVRHCCKLSLYSTSRKTNDSNSRKWQKNTFWAWFRPIGAKFRMSFFSLKNLTSQSLDIVVSYQQLIQSWENLVMDGQMEKETDRPMRDYMGLCLTNIEHPKTHKHTKIQKIILSFISCCTVHLLNWLMKRSFNFIFSFVFFVVAFFY